MLEPDNRKDLESFKQTVNKVEYCPVVWWQEDELELIEEGK